MGILMILSGFGHKKQSQSAGRWTEIRNPKHKIRNGWNGIKMNEAYLKKQSQFVTAQNNVKSYMKGDYDNITASGVAENKANQSQIWLIK